MFEFRKLLDGFLDTVGDFQLDFLWRGTGIWSNDNGFLNGKIRIFQLTELKKGGNATDNEKCNDKIR